MIDEVCHHLDTHRGWWSAEDLAAALGIDPLTASIAADRLVDAGLADVWSTGRARRWAGASHGIR